VSVLLPVRNAADSLDAALRSVARQSESRFECLLVDDGSSDASPLLMERLARRDPRFRVIRAGGDGLVAALDLGLAARRWSRAWTRTT
jgi:glycosyltransferase involved in cell wall biosynthesis